MIFKHYEIILILRFDGHYTNVDEVNTIPTPMPAPIPAIIVRSRLPTPEEKEECLCNIEQIFAEQHKFIKFEYLTLKTSILNVEWNLLLKQHEPTTDPTDSKKALTEILNKLYSDEMLKSIPDEKQLDNLAPAFYLALQCQCPKHLRNDEVLRFVHKVADNGDLEQLRLLVHLIDDWNKPLDNVTPLMKASSKGDVGMVQFMLGLSTLKHLYHKSNGETAITLAAKANNGAIGNTTQLLLLHFYTL